MTKFEILDSIKFICLRKRLKGELYKLLTLYDNIYVGNEEDKIIFIIEKKINKKKIIYKFIISNNYPYNPPNVYINNINYGQYLHCPNKFLNILKYLRGIDCFCCVSYTCKSNWNPCMNLNYIIEEFENVIDTKYNIMLKIFLDKIKEKFLNMDIELESWLFNRSNKTK